MSQNSQDAIDVLSKVIVDTIDKKLDDASFDKSQTGVVTAVNGNTYTIAVFGSQYNITSDQIFTVGQSVVVTALQGDMKRLVCSPDNIGTMKTVDNKVKVVGDKLSSFIDKNFADTLNRIDQIKNQVDKSFMSWFYDGAPTLENAPAKDWTTDDAKRLHVGDLYYDTTSGYSYEWVVNDGVYSWNKITDSGIQEALKNASKAQDTADGKRRVFYDTPSTPYDRGDMWAQGGTGDLLICNVARTITDSYHQTDWILASKYTDDTKANEALDSANKANTDLAEFKTEYDSDLKITKEQIESRVTKTTYTKDLNGLKTRVGAAETKISQNADAITFRATKDEAANYAASAEQNAKNELYSMMTFTADNGLVITKSGWEGKVQITGQNVQVVRGNNRVIINDNGIDITNGYKSVSIYSDGISFHGIRNGRIFEWPYETDSYGNLKGEFTAQTTKIDLSSYSSVMLVYDTYKDGTWLADGGSAGRLTVILPVNGKTYSYAYPWNTVHWREVTVSYDGITFGNGNERTSDYKNNVITGVIHLEVPISDGVKKNDKVCRPLELYGFM